MGKVKNQGTGTLKNDCKQYLKIGIIKAFIECMGSLSNVHEFVQVCVRYFYF